MTLTDLIRKRGTGKLATAIPAIPATQAKEGPATVAGIATVAVANPTEEEAAQHWTAGGHAETEQAEQSVGAIVGATETNTDDRITCLECGNFHRLGTCLAARRREIAADLNYRPVADFPRRCEGFRPTLDDPDPRTGRERWPWLVTG